LELFSNVTDSTTFLLQLFPTPLQIILSRMSLDIFWPITNNRDDTKWSEVNLRTTEFSYVFLFKEIFLKIK
jgi:hypothetical protein